MIYTVDGDVIVIAKESVEETEETEELYDTFSEKLTAYMETQW